MQLLPGRGRGGGGAAAGRSFSEASEQASLTAGETRAGRGRHCEPQGASSGGSQAPAVKHLKRGGGEQEATEEALAEGWG